MTTRRSVTARLAAHRDGSARRCTPCAPSRPIRRYTCCGGAHAALPQLARARSSRKARASRAHEGIAEVAGAAAARKHRGAGGLARLLIEGGFLARLPGAVADVALEFERSRGRPWREDVILVRHREAGNAGVHRQRRNPSRAGLVVRREGGFAQAQAARPVHVVMQRFVLKRKAGLGDGRRRQPRRHGHQDDRLVAQVGNLRRVGNPPDFFAASHR